MVSDAVTRVRTNITKKDRENGLTELPKAGEGSWLNRLSGALERVCVSVCVCGEGYRKKKRGVTSPKKAGCRSLCQLGEHTE